MNIPERIFPKDFDHINIIDDEGLLVACLGIVITLYIEEPYHQSIRMGSVECIEEYIELVKPYLRWVSLMGNRIKNFRKTQLAPISAQISQLDPMDYFEMILSGAEKVEMANHYNLVALLRGKRKFKRMGFLTATLPFGFLEKQPTGFLQKLVVCWCNRLKAFHGYAGFAIMRSVDYAYAEKAEPYLHPMVKRFPGMEIDMPSSHLQYCTDGIKGINWLTILSNIFLERLGGKINLKAKLGDEFPFYDYKGGTVIQAGPYPQIGDMDQNNIPLHYQKLYRQVRPIQAEYPDILIETPQGIDAQEFAQEWLKRFS
jgi:hypothetical protein